MLSGKIVLLFLSATLAASQAQSPTLSDVALDCNATACTIDKNCRCSSALSPLGDLANYPQLIAITFTDAVSSQLYEIVNNMLSRRLNPDGLPMLATFFVPHEYTDYQLVNGLYNKQHEIAVYSITRNNLQEYWRTASADVLEKEFGGQREIISKFANIPITEIRGARTPQYQLAGNNSFKAYVKAGLSYDNTWPTIPKEHMFPYTLDYRSVQECDLGDYCPNESFPGFWVVPINDLNGLDRECNNLAACNVTGTTATITGWLLNEVNRVRTQSKVPMTLSVDLNYFESVENTEEAFNSFLDQLPTDVYVVTQRQVIEFMKNPQDLKHFKTDYVDNKAVANCNRYSCNYEDSPGNPQVSIFMKSCTKCPKNYPWLGNPDGQ